MRVNFVMDADELPTLFQISNKLLCISVSQKNFLLYQAGLRKTLLVYQE
jgi:hypothetical protein